MSPPVYRTIALSFAHLQTSSSSSVDQPRCLSLALRISTNYTAPLCAAIAPCSETPIGRRAFRDRAGLVLEVVANFDSIKRESESVIQPYSNDLSLAYHVHIVIDCLPIKLPSFPPLPTEATSLYISLMAAKDPRGAPLTAVSRYPSRYYVVIFGI